MKTVNFVTAFCIIVLFSYILHLRNVDQREINNLKDTMTDTIIHYKVNDSLNAARITILEVSNDDNFLKLKTKDEQIKQLQSIVKQYKEDNRNLNTAISIATKTVVNYQDSIRSLIIGYSNIHKPCPDPIYSHAFSIDSWVIGTVTVGIDTVSVNEAILNDYTVTIGEEKVSLFKSKKYADIINLNPMSETTAMRVYQHTTMPTLSSTGKTVKNIGTGTAIGIIIAKLILWK